MTDFPPENALTFDLERIFHQDFFVNINIFNSLHNEPYRTLGGPLRANLCRIPSATPPLTLVSQYPASYIPRVSMLEPVSGGT